MQLLLRKLFNLKKGEGRPVLLFATLAFLWAWASSMALRFADASFIIHVGAEELPTVYIATASCLFLTSFLLLFAFHITSPLRIFLTALMIEIIFFGMSSFAMFMHVGIQSQWVWYGMRIMSYIFLTTNLTCFWTFTDQYHHMQDAKRMFGLFTSMIFLGRAATGLIMQSGLFNLQQVFFLVMIILITVGYWVINIHKKLNIAHDELEQDVKTKHENTVSYLMTSILNSPFTLILMASNLITFILWSTTEFNYMLVFDNHFEPSTAPLFGSEQNADLTVFLGKCLASVSIVNLIFGLFIYSRLVRKIGVNGVIFGTSLLFLFCFSGWQFGTTLFFPIIGYLIVEGMLDVVDDSNFSLLLNAVPQKVKYKIRVMIESFVEPIGMLISGILLGINGLNSLLLGLGLAICLFIAVFILRKYYLPAIYENLRQNAIHFERHPYEWFKEMPEKRRKSNEYRLFGLLKHGDKEDKKLAITGLIASQDEAILKQLLQQLDSLDYEIKIDIIPFLTHNQFQNQDEINQLLLKWANSEHQELAGQALYALAQRSQLSLKDAYHLLSSSHPLSKIAGFFALRKKAPSARDSIDSQLNVEFFLKKEESLNVLGIKALASNPTKEDFETLSSFLFSPSISIATEAARAIAQTTTTPPVHITPLILKAIKEQEEHTFRLECLKSLQNTQTSPYAKELILISDKFRPAERRLTQEILSNLDHSILPILLDVVKNISIANSSRILAAQVLGNIAEETFRTHLFEIIQIESERAEMYAQGAISVATLEPNSNYQLLEETLWSGFHSILDFIVHLLGASKEVEDCELLSKLIRSRSVKIRSQVIEALEKSCKPAIFRLLLPLITETGIQPNSKTEENLLPIILAPLLHSSSELDHMVAIILKYRLQLPNWKSDIAKLIENASPLFHNFAREMLT